MVLVSNAQDARLRLSNIDHRLDQRWRGNIGGPDSRRLVPALNKIEAAKTHLTKIDKLRRYAKQRLQEAALLLDQVDAAQAQDVRDVEADI